MVKQIVSWTAEKIKSGFQISPVLLPPPPHLPNNPSFPTALSQWLCPARSQSPWCYSPLWQQLPLIPRPFPYYTLRQTSHAAMLIALPRATQARSCLKGYCLYGCYKLNWEQWSTPCFSLTKGSPLYPASNFNRTCRDLTPSTSLCAIKLVDICKFGWSLPKNQKLLASNWLR